MRHDVHLAALRAAAKVAFSMALLNGCAAEDPTEPSTQGAASQDLTGPSGSSANDTGADRSHANCAEILSCAFPGPDEYGTPPTPESSEVVACCDQALGGHNIGGAHRWACCAAYDPAEGKDHTGASKHVMACTPWGPPVPPSIERLRAKREQRRAAKRARAELLAVA
jgi:hypothetical protein